MYLNDLIEFNYPEFTCVHFYVNHYSLYFIFIEPFDSLHNQEIHFFKKYIYLHVLSIFDKHIIDI